jgi:hypothetical protein
MDEVSCGVPGMHTEADVAYAALSTITIAMHETADAVEQGRTFIGHPVGAVAVGWNEQARTTGRFTGLSGCNAADGTMIHAETIVGAKARDYGMRVLYLGVLAPAQLTAKDSGGPYPCLDCRTMFDADENREFTLRTILLSGAGSGPLMLGTLAQLRALHDPALRRGVALDAADVPPARDPHYENRLLHQLGPVWASVYPGHRAARSLASWGRYTQIKPRPTGSY